VCFFLIGLASALLASEEAQAQFNGPLTVTSTETVNNDATVNSTAGSFVVRTTGDNQPGFNIIGGGLFTVSPSTFGTFIFTEGANSPGIDVSSANHVMSLQNLTITTSGAGSDGISLERQGESLTAANVTVTTSGANASALAITAAGGGQASTESFTDSALRSALGPVIRVSGGGTNKTILLTRSSVTAAPDGQWLNVVGAGNGVSITASASNLTGAAITDSGSTSTLNLTNGTFWSMTGSSNVTNLTNNASTIIFSAPTGNPEALQSYKMLTVNTYTGVGGRIGLNTFLGTDSSPSDRLVINGTATGDTRVRITNTGGPGALTTGNGILVVDATNGTTAQAMFALAGEVRAGFHDYFLERGGINGSNPQDWFLRSDFLGGNGNGNGGNGPTIPPDELPPEPPPGEPLPPGIYPIIGPEIATYGVVQPIARQMGLTTLGTLHERVGDAAAVAACLGADSSSSSATLPGAAITKAPPVPYGNCRPAVWGRLFGQQIDNHYQAFADPRASGQVIGIQTGVDLWRGSLIPGHSDTAGLYFAYSNGNVGVDGLVTNAAATGYILQRTGSLNLNAYSVGGYWTHYGPTGWYIDAVLQGSFYNGNATTPFANLPTNGTGFTSSLEAGYPIPLPVFGPGFVLEPEGQIIWQQVSFDDANDGLGQVGLGTTSGASGRLGLRGKWTINDAAGRVWQPNVVANVWRDWGADATTTFGIDRVPLLEQATRLEFAGGLSAKILPGLSLYAQAGYQFAVSDTDGGRRDGVKGDFGVHYAW
jgi:outer membrane autotransporter protein